jgi:D-sedoheptulose 7-phosphate isomerase
VTDERAHIHHQLQESIALAEALADNHTTIMLAIAEALTGVLRGGGCIYLCGNGGSAADAQHVAGELVGRFLRQRRALAAVALTTDTSILTSIGNDVEFAQIFARQVDALVTDADALVGISTSGRSPNILYAVEAARAKGALTVGFTGSPGLPLAGKVDLCLQIPSSHTARIQEAHILTWHIICDYIERAFLPA